jgi:hypothetical protein
MKKMERLSGELFRPLTPDEQKRVAGRFGGGGGPVTETPITAYETFDPVPDWARDGDNE